MSLVISPRMQFVDVNGHPYAGAKAYVYLTTTTTLAVIYDDAALTTGHELPNPLIADSTGMFPAAYFDDSVEYRLKITNSTGSLTILDVDPVNKTLLITASEIADGAIEAKLGYTPVDPANAAFTAQATLIYTTEPVSLSPYAMGYLGAPVNIKDVAYSFILSDAGKLVLHDDANPFTWTIPLNSAMAFPVGTLIYLGNINSGLITVARGTDGVTTVALYIEGIATNGDITLGQWATGYIRKVDTDTWIYVGTTGSGLITKDANFTLAASDNGRKFLHDDASGYAYTLPLNATVPLPVGFEFEVIQIGAGATTLTRAGGVALRVAGSSTDANVVLAQWDRAKCTKVGTDSWLVNYSA
jgi:hypothetical protein